MTRKLWLLPLLALAAFAAVFAACNDDSEEGGSEEERAEIEELMTTLLETDPTDQEQVDFWIAHFTDQVIEDFFGTTKKECAANAEDCIGEPVPVERFEDTSVDGTDAITTVYSADDTVFTVALIEEGDTWQVNEIRFGPQNLPEGVTAVDLQLEEYKFVFDESTIEDGNIGFPFENIGQEPHEIVVLKTNEEFDQDAVIDFFAAQEEPGEELPPGVEDANFISFAPPGAQGIAYGGEEFEPGEYAFICMIPDPEGTPHAANGMLTEFTVPE